MARVNSMPRFKKAGRPMPARTAANAVGRTCACGPRAAAQPVGASRAGSRMQPARGAGASGATLPSLRRARGGGAGGGGERLVEVGDDVGRGLEADRQADHLGPGAGFFELLLVELAVRG
jgi:hypothetical protein